MISTLKKLVTYTLKDNFFVSLLKENDTKEIIVASSVQTGTDISVHRPVHIRDNLSVQGNIFLGRSRKPLFDGGNKLLKENISTEGAVNGNILGVYYDKYIDATPKDFIYLSPLFPMVRIYNESQFLVEEFENKNYSKTWTFTLPSYVKTNNVRIQFYFLNTSEQFCNVSFLYKLFTIDHMNDDNTIMNELNFKTKKGIIESDIYSVNIKADDCNFKVNNKLICLRIYRNKKNGSIDNLQESIYLLGVKIEYDSNYFNN